MIEKKYMADAEYLRDRFKREHRDLIGPQGQYDPLALVGFAVKIMYEERKIMPMPEPVSSGELSTYPDC